MTPVERLLAKLPDAKQVGQGLVGTMPGPRRPSGRVCRLPKATTAGRWCKCHAGCTADAICAAVGLHVRGPDARADMLTRSTSPEFTCAGENGNNGQAPHRRRV